MPNVPDTLPGLRPIADQRRYRTAPQQTSAAEVIGAGLGAVAEGLQPLVREQRERDEALRRSRQLTNADFAYNRAFNALRQKRDELLTRQGTEAVNVLPELEELNKKMIEQIREDAQGDEIVANRAIQSYLATSQSIFGEVSTFQNKSEIALAETEHSTVVAAWGDQYARDGNPQFLDWAIEKAVAHEDRKKLTGVADKAAKTLAEKVVRETFAEQRFNYLLQTQGPNAAEAWVLDGNKRYAPAGWDRKVEDARRLIEADQTRVFNERNDEYALNFQKLIIDVGYENAVRQVADPGNVTGLAKKDQAAYLAMRASMEEGQRRNRAIEAARNLISESGEPVSVEDLKAIGAPDEFIKSQVTANYNARVAEVRANAQAEGAEAEAVDQVRALEKWNGEYQKNPEKALDTNYMTTIGLDARSQSALLSIARRDAVKAVDVKRTQAELEKENAKTLANFNYLQARIDGIRSAGEFHRDVQLGALYSNLPPPMRGILDDRLRALGDGGEVWAAELAAMFAEGGKLWEITKEVPGWNLSDQDTAELMGKKKDAVRQYLRKFPNKSLDDAVDAVFGDDLNRARSKKFLDARAKIKTAGRQALQGGSPTPVQGGQTSPPAIIVDLEKAPEADANLINEIDNEE